MIYGFILFLSFAVEPKLLVRVYDTPLSVAGLDIAGAKRGEWVDVVVTQAELSRLSGKNITIIAQDIEKLLESVKGFYHSYDGFVDTFAQIAINYPEIAKLDTIGISWEGCPILALKISDNVEIDEDEPEILFDGLHHAREWPTMEIALFYADTLTKAYGVDTHITDVVNSREIWIVPCVNPDGYRYSYDQGNEWWRKNRRTPEGVDLNRNYNGSCNGSRWGAWGSIDNAKASHDSIWQTYCGEDAFSEYETQAIRDLVASHNFTFYVTYHTYGEMVMWPWGYMGTGAPDSTILSDIGQGMAQRIARQDTGTYNAYQCYYLYPTTGTSKEWAYGYGLYIQGMPILAYTIETCISFHPDTSALAQVVRENFDAAIYLCDIADSVRNLLVPMIVPPIITQMDTSIGDYDISWSSTYSADKYKLNELTEFSAIEDSAEDSTDLWYFWGFTRSTSNPHSGVYSYFSDSSDNNVISMTTKYPLPSSDSLTFWCEYDIQSPNDRVFVEVSPNRKEMKILDSFTGNSGGWVKKFYTLPRYKSLFIRFRYTTDNGGLGAGFYVDDIYPVPKFDSVTTISDSIIDTFYTMSGKPLNTYWYQVQGYNSRGWGDFSQIENIVVVESGISEEGLSFRPKLACSPNPFTKVTKIRVWGLGIRGKEINLTIYDLAGRAVRTFNHLTTQLFNRIVWDSRDEFGKKVSSGIYFVVLKAGDFKKITKVTLIR
ncbi:MAG: T9SS type A sorting domain-containing protein [Candidatus Stahlbacteria bacterium]|nr:T9SS type A sorting domain-containing protein [Candidatus Stahlbacteria bacterium]